MLYVVYTVCAPLWGRGSREGEILTSLKEFFKETLLMILMVEFQQAEPFLQGGALR